jgi:hypothetical protein
MADSSPTLRLGEFEEGAPAQLCASTLLRHLVCFGATGSGKTVACKVLCEELLKQGIPVIAVDPQGDIASMALPPTSDSGAPGAAADLHAHAEFVVWTPASAAGRQLCVRPFGVELPADGDERTRSIGRLAMNVAGLVVSSKRELDEARSVIEIVLADAHARACFPETFADLGACLESPSDGLRQAIERVAPAPLVERLRLAVNRLNVGSRKLLFEDGEPLDVEALLGVGAHAGPKTRMSVVYLNTLASQDEKEFFLGLLVEQLYCWMLARPSADLRGVLYIDELAPFLPPVRRTACKEALLLLIRQARKYGIGLILATQNIGDLDYKSLNQCATWLLGKSSARRELEKASDQLRALPGSEADRILGELPGLPRGEFFVLSPDEFDRPRRVKVRWLESAHETLDEDRLRVLPKTTAAIRTAAGRAPPREQPAPAIPAVPAPPAPTALPAPTPLPAKAELPAPMPLPAPTALPEKAALPAPTPPLFARHPPPEEPSPRTSEPPTAARGDPMEPVALDVLLRQDYVPVNPTPYQVEAILKLHAQGEGGGRLPMTLALVVDQSGSMGAERKLERVKEAIARMTRALSPNDRLALIGFSDQAIVHVPLGQATSANRAIRALSTIGGTRVSAGLEEALGQLEDALDPEHVNRVLVLTDGNTSGDERECFDLANEIRESGAAVHCLGVGTDWNQPFIRELSGGSFDYLQGSDDIEPLFDRLFRQLQSVVVRRATIAVDGIGGTRLENVLHCRLDPAGRSEDAVRAIGRGPAFALENLALGESQALVLPLVFTPARPGRFALARVRVEGTIGGRSFSVSREIAITATPDRNLYERVNGDAVALLARIHVNRASQEAIMDLESGDPQRIARGTNRLRGTTRRLDEMGEHELANLTRRVLEQVETSQKTDSPELKALRQNTKRL